MVRQISRKGPTKRASERKSKHKPKPCTPAVKLPEKKTKPYDPAVAGEALHRIKEAEHDLASSEAKYNEAKVSAREAKASMEKKRKRLHEIIAEEVGSIPSLYSAQTQAAVVEGNEPWRSEPISNLTVPGRIVKALAAHHITTIGEYCDYVKPQANGFMPRLTDVPGMGPAAITAFEDAMDKFWTEQKKKDAERTKEVGEAIEEVADSTKLPEPSENGDGEETELESGDE